MSIKKKTPERSRNAQDPAARKTSPLSLLTACGLLFAWLLPSRKMPINTSSNANLASRARKGTSLVESCVA